MAVEQSYTYNLKFQIKSIWSFAFASGKIFPQRKETEEVSLLFLGCWQWLLSGALCSVMAGWPQSGREMGCF